MTAKTLEKVPVNLGGFAHAESVYSMDDIATSLPTSVAIFPNNDLGAHYDQINVAAGKKTVCVCVCEKHFIHPTSKNKTIKNCFFFNISQMTARKNNTDTFLLNFGVLYLRSLGW